jgi:hypothetical protein
VVDASSNPYRRARRGTKFVLNEQEQIVELAAGVMEADSFWRIRLATAGWTIGEKARYLYPAFTAKVDVIAQKRSLSMTNVWTDMENVSFGSFHGIKRLQASFLRNRTKDRVGVLL